MQRYRTLLTGCVCTLSVLALAGSLGAASEGRVVGTVVDVQGKPLKDVEVVISAVNVHYEQSRTTNKKGQFTLVLLDASREFTIRIQKEGYQAIDEPLNPSVGGTLRRTWTLVQGGDDGGGAGITEGPGELDAGSRAVRIYEAGYKALTEGDYQTAVAKFKQVAEQAPELPEPQAALAMTYLQMDRLDESLAAAESVLELDPDNVLAYRVIYEIHTQQGNLEQQEAALLKLEQLDPGTETARRMFNSGVRFIQEGQLEEAMGRFERALKLDAELGPAHAALTRVHLNRGNVDKALEYGERLIELEPDNAEVLTLLYVAYRNRGDEEKAQNVFSILQSNRPDYVGTGFLEQGVNYFNNGNVEAAAEIFEGVLETLPDHPRAHYMLALCLFSTGDLSRAKDLLTRFLELAPDHPDAATAREMLATL